MPNLNVGPQESSAPSYLSFFCIRACLSLRQRLRREYLLAMRAIWFSMLPRPQESRQMNPASYSANRRSRIPKVAPTSLWTCTKPTPLRCPDGRAAQRWAGSQLTLNPALSLTGIWRRWLLVHKSLPEHKKERSLHLYSVTLAAQQPPHADLSLVASPLDYRRLAICWAKWNHICLQIPNYSPATLSFH